MPRALVAGLIIVEALALAACVSPGDANDSQATVIGLYADLSSTGAREGNDILKGAELRVQEANLSRGRGGSVVVLRYLDMKQNPTEAVKSYTRLAQEMGACVVIGSGVLNAGVAVSPVAEMVKVPLLSLSLDDRVSTPEIAPGAVDSIGTVRRYVFMVRPSGAQIAAAAARYAVGRFPARRYATFYDPSNPVSLMQARSFENVIRKAGKLVVMSQEASSGEADDGPAIRRLRDADTEAVFVCGTVAQNAAFARKAREMSWRPTLIGNQAWYDPMVTRAAGAAEGAWFAMGVAPDDQALEGISERFLAVYGEPPRPAVLCGFGAIGLALAAVERAGTTDPQAVRDLLEQTTGYQGILSTFEMDRKTHRPFNPPVAIMRITDGRYVTVEARFTPESAKTASPSP
jgi:branched-chain amino acid transport system substrate-binding protein